MNLNQVAKESVEELVARGIWLPEQGSKILTSQMLDHSRFVCSQCQTGSHEKSCEPVNESDHRIERIRTFFEFPDLFDGMITIPTRNLIGRLGLLLFWVSSTIWGVSISMAFLLLAYWIHRTTSTASGVRDEKSHL